MRCVRAGRKKATPEVYPIEPYLRINKLKAEMCSTLSGLRLTGLRRGVGERGNVEKREAQPNRPVI